MENFFGNIYYLFVGLFGQHLSDYLWGYNCQTQGWDSPVVYLPIGLTMTITTVFFCILYYYIVNHPRINKWWHWIITCAIVFVTNFLVALFWTKTHLESGLIPECLQYTYLPDGDVLENITSYNCWLFGLTNGIVSAMLFFVLSIIVKRWSRNCRHTPWRSLLPKRNK